MALLKFPKALDKLQRATPDEIYLALKASKWTHDDVYVFAQKQAVGFRANIFAALIRFPFSKKPKGPGGLPVPQDRWITLLAANALGYYFIEKKKPAEALRVLQPFAVYQKNYPYLARNLAAAYAQTGDAAKAVAALKFLADIGWEHMSSMATESDIKAILNNPACKALFAKWFKTGKAKNGYVVGLASLEKSLPRSFAPRARLLDFAALVRTLVHGSIGYFSLAGAGRHPYFGPSFHGYNKKQPLDRHFIEFLSLGEGSTFAFWNPGETWEANPAIVLLGSEGEYRLVADNLEDLLIKISKRKTGEEDIDQKFDDDEDQIDSRDVLQDWLKQHKVKAPKPPKRPNFLPWLKQRGVQSI